MNYFSTDAPFLGYDSSRTAPLLTRPRFHNGIAGIWEPKILSEVEYDGICAGNVDGLGGVGAAFAVPQDLHRQTDPRRGRPTRPGRYVRSREGRKRCHRCKSQKD